MADQQENQNQQSSADYKKNTKDNTIGGAQTNIPDPDQQNETGYAGTTNAVSEDQQDKDGYRIAPEDTLIGYDGHEDQMDMDLDDKDKRRSGSSTADDNR